MTKPNSLQTPPPESGAVVHDHFQRADPSGGADTLAGALESSTESPHTESGFGETIKSVGNLLVQKFLKTRAEEYRSFVEIEERRAYAAERMGFYEGRIATKLELLGAVEARVLRAKDVSVGITLAKAGEDVIYAPRKFDETLVALTRELVLAENGDEILSVMRAELAIIKAEFALFKKEYAAELRALGIKV